MIRQLIFGTSIRATDLPEKKHHGDVALAQLLQKAYSSPDSTLPHIGMAKLTILQLSAKAVHETVTLVTA